MCELLGMSANVPTDICFSFTGLVQRGGGMYYEQKERSAYAHGAIAMLVYNNVPGMLYMSITDWKMPCAFISQEAGEYLKAQENKVLTVGAADKLVASPAFSDEGV